MEVAFGIMNREWFDPRRFDFKLLKELLAIAIPLLPNFLIYWVFNSCDKVMITNMIGIGAAGIYSVGSKLGYIHPFAIVATGTVIMPGIEIGQDALVAAGCTVTKNVEPYAVVMGNPGKPRGDVRTIKSKITGEPIYPWRHHFDHYMPWAESDFDTWYKSLDLEIRKEYKIDTLNG